jgi:hypothetical protein
MEDLIGKYGKNLKLLFKKKKKGKIYLKTDQNSGYIILYICFLSFDSHKTILKRFKR